MNCMDIFRTNLKSVLDNTSKKEFYEKARISTSLLSMLMSKSRKFHENHFIKIETAIDFPFHQLFVSNIDNKMVNKDELNRMTNILTTPGARESLIAEVYRIEKLYAAELAQRKDIIEHVSL